jgi:dephospho-CoA kinase
VKKILLTGISGSGKSTLAAALAARGYKSVDADTDEWSQWVEYVGDSEQFGPPVEPQRDWVWREDRIAELLATLDAEVLFLSGCAENMGQFLPQFDHVVLLSASPALIVERLSTRTNNPYGKQPDELARVLSHKETVEPLLRAAAHHEMDTGAPLDQVVDMVLRLVHSA